MNPWWRRIDLLSIACTLLLAVLGLLMIFSATGRAGPGSEVSRQALMLAVGAGVMVLATMIDYRAWWRAAPWLYAMLLGLLVAVLLVGTAAKGAQRWIDLGPLGAFQPSEPAKLLLILVLARVLAGEEEDDEEPPGARFFKGMVLIGLPMLLIMLQPDLGTAIATASVGMAMMYVAGIPRAWLLGVVAMALSVFPFVLHDYQRERLMVFLNPEADPTGSGWNILQSRIAIGSGGVWGKGLFQGTQNQLDFVPEHHTDFIFTVLAEEMGLVGSVVLLMLLAGLVYSAFRTAQATRSRYGSYLAAGIGTLFAVHILVNLGMTVGLCPVVGIPLPFLSYGGSAAITTLAGLGILNSLWLRRPRAPD